jgi:hypothetical protein
MNRLSPQDARWLALLIDTEGTITINRSKRPTGKHVYCAVVSCGMTSRVVIDEIVRLLGTGNVYVRAGTNRPIYYWQEASKRAVAVIEQIEPWLLVKRSQALLALQLEARKAQRGKRLRLDVDELAARESIKCEMTSLNAGTP